MLRIYPRYSAQDTKDYYKQALSTSDYYSEKGEIIGQWRGQTAEKIGLSDKVNEQQFNHLCDNINPVTEEKLTPRTNENRRVAYDFTFSVPKSISLAYAINDDPQILEAFQSSYLETMNLIEQNAETRVRVGGKKEERVTENLLYSDYIHSTSRPLEDGTPDPHLHVHCVVMNVTYDDKEEKFKAVELGNVRRDAPFYQAYFNSLLADKLSKAGYDIVKTKDAFGLANVSRETEMKFSRRTSEIEKM
ncbi:MAG: MobF family relaxase, partial [Bacteroidota bacterium]